MAEKRHKVMVFTGAAHPEFVRNVGWFNSTAAAEEWCERKRLGHTPVDGEWCVIPRRDDDVQPSVNEDGS